MEKNNFPDTAQILTEEDLLFINSVRKIKRTLMASFQPGFFVQTIKNIIESSSIVEFASARAVKFLNDSTTTFVIILNKEKAMEKIDHQFLNITSPEEETKWIANCIYDEVISPFTTTITEALINNEEALESVFIVSQEELHETLESLSKFLLSSVFGIKIDLESYRIHLELLK